MFDEDDYTDEIQNLRWAGMQSARREEMRIGMVKDKKLIKRYKAKYGALWFSDATYSTIILKRYDGQVFFLDLLNKNPLMTTMFWINK